jgi:hypothetical protein
MIALQEPQPKGTHASDGTRRKFFLRNRGSLAGHYQLGAECRALAAVGAGG